MSTRRMTRETRVEVVIPGGWWTPCLWAHRSSDGGCLRDPHLPHRTVERYVTEWVEVVE